MYVLYILGFNTNKLWTLWLRHSKKQHLNEVNVFTILDVCKSNKSSYVENISFYITCWVDWGNDGCLSIFRHHYGYFQFLIFILPKRFASALDECVYRDNIFKSYGIGFIATISNIYCMSSSLENATVYSLYTLHSENNGFLFNLNKILNKYYMIIVELRFQKKIRV